MTAEQIMSEMAGTLAGIQAEMMSWHVENIRAEDMVRIDNWVIDRPSGTEWRHYDEVLTVKRLGEDLAEEKIVAAGEKAGLLWEWLCDSSVDLRAWKKAR